MLHHTRILYCWKANAGGRNDEESISGDTVPTNRQRLHQSRECGATYLRYCMSGCNSIPKSDISIIRFIEWRQHEPCGILDGSELSLRTIGSGDRKTQTAINDILEKKILFGFQQHFGRFFHQEVVGWNDSFSDKRCNFWFGEHPDNVQPFERWQKRFADYLCKIGFISEKQELSKEIASKVPPRCKSCFSIVLLVFICNRWSTSKRIGVDGCSS